MKVISYKNINLANFIGLAEGTRKFTDPKTQKWVKRNFYDNLIFHRVIKQFMIQGGDPLGNGTGNPGYKFEDEIVSSLVFDNPGILAMANSGPNTNGSQFFITVEATPWLNGNHTIFGKVTDGHDVVNAISMVATGAGNRPLENVVIEGIEITKSN